MSFLHLVRDGRDMALSDNQNQPKKHYQALFGDAYEACHDAAPECAIRLWATANSQVADWGERELGNRYMRVRFEDVCASPRVVMYDTLIKKWHRACCCRPGQCRSGRRDKDPLRSVDGNAYLLKMRAPHREVCRYAEAIRLPITKQTQWRHRRRIHTVYKTACCANRERCSPDKPRINDPAISMTPNIKASSRPPSSFSACIGGHISSDTDMQYPWC